MRHKGKAWGKCVRGLEDMRIDEEDSGNGRRFEDDSGDDED
jgi:hypothetical protein